MDRKELENFEANIGYISEQFVSQLEILTDQFDDDLIGRDEFIEKITKDREMSVQGISLKIK